MFVVSIIWEKRAWPIYWQFLAHTGSSNLAQQQALLRPVCRLLKGYEIVVIGATVSEADARTRATNFVQLSWLIGSNRKRYTSRYA
ncbi:MAG: hypothetical protein AB1861_31420 [Cyanobacteriota bacterium]